jgi:hypothetical protein
MPTAAANNQTRGWMMANQADVADALRRWRAAENELLGVATGSPEFRTLRTEVMGLREEFRRLSDDALRVRDHVSRQITSVQGPA